MRLESRGLVYVSWTSQIELFLFPLVHKFVGLLILFPSPVVIPINKNFATLHLAEVISSFTTGRPDNAPMEG